MITHTHASLSIYTHTGILGLVTTFVLAVETTKAYLTSLRERVARVAAAWRHHRSLRLLQSNRPLAAGGPASMSTKIAIGMYDDDLRVHSRCVCC